MSKEESIRKPDWVITPGQVAEHLMNLANTPREQFARRLELTTEQLESFFKGELSVTRELAFALKSVTGVEASFWIKSEKEYRHKMEKLKARTAASEKAAG